MIQTIILAADAVPTIPDSIGIGTAATVCGVLVSAIVWLSKIYLSSIDAARLEYKTSHQELVTLTRECITAIREFQATMMELINKLDLKDNK